MSDVTNRMQFDSPIAMKAGDKIVYEMQLDSDIVLESGDALVTLFGFETSYFQVKEMYIERKGSGERIPVKLRKR